MRTSIILASCLMAISAVSAAQLAGPAATPSPHFQKRKIMERHQSMLPRMPLGNGLFGSSDDGTHKDSTDSDKASSTSSSSMSSSTSSSSSFSSSSSTRISSSTSSAAPSSTSTAAPTSSSSSAGTTPTSSSVVFLTSTLQPTSSSSAAPAPAQTSGSSQDNSGSSHTGLIVGVSVVGGVAILGALIFLYMKFGGRRFSDYDNDDADIKWPELKTDENAAAMQPLPARRTGGAGFDMGEDSDHGHDMNNLGGDAHSMTEYGGKQHDSMVGSTTALNSGIGSGTYGAGTYTHGGDADTYNAPAGGVTGYYDPYGSYSHGGQGQQVFYPDQTSQGQDFQGYGGYGHDQNAYGTSSSPQQNPYRVGQHTGQGGY
ncbi:uncharacterized protein FA14DRAFT_154606 [Meira miltonrushii]|uniref:Mid2 domain-containing protein n=1 Tax=Meira miltonrushii TaxID=1280837 RepID=A0A316VC91_9BASI|nr:uncharacterized protein FA14DRAFT_154606 [Meira miltonrushii]PWN35182.1 hypothetical protein FA14DRAFT_154606 [Meira miltonrushii]